MMKDKVEKIRCDEEGCTTIVAERRADWPDQVTVGTTVDQARGLRCSNTRRRFKTFSELSAMFIVTMKTLPPTWHISECAAQNMLYGWSHFSGHECVLAFTSFPH